MCERLAASTTDESALALLRRPISPGADSWLQSGQFTLPLAAIGLYAAAGYGRSNHDAAGYGRVNISSEPTKKQRPI